MCFCLCLSFRYDSSSGGLSLITNVTTPEHRFTDLAVDTTGQFLYSLDRGYYLFLCIMTTVAWVLLRALEVSVIAIQADGQLSLTATNYPFPTDPRKFFLALGSRSSAG